MFKYYGLYQRIEVRKKKWIVLSSPSRGNQLGGSLRVVSNWYRKTFVQGGHQLVSSILWQKTGATLRPTRRNHKKAQWAYDQFLSTLANMRAPFQWINVYTARSLVHFPGVREWKQTDNELPWNASGVYEADRDTTCTVQVIKIYEHAPRKTSERISVTLNFISGSSTANSESANVDRRQSQGQIWRSWCQYENSSPRFLKIYSAKLPFWNNDFWIIKNEGVVDLTVA